MKCKYRYLYLKDFFLHLVFFTFLWKIQKGFRMIPKFSKI